MLRRFVEFFTRQSLMTLLLWIGLFLFGSVAYLNLLPREGFPAVDVPIAIGSGLFFVDDVEVVDDAVAPLANALSSEEGVNEVVTVSRENFFTVITEFEEGITSADGAALVEETAERVGLPSDVTFSASDVDVAKFLVEFDLLVGVYGQDQPSPDELREAAETLVPFFEDQTDVARVEVLDLTDQAIDPATGEAIQRVARYSQIATEADRTEILPSIAVGVVQNTGVDSLGIRDATDAALDSAAGADALPAGFEARVAIDQATQIRQQIDSLEGNVLTGVIAVAIIALLLISWRASIITAVFLISVIAVTMLLFWLVGITLSTISLFGVILALGLFVDDSIVITEAIDQFRGDDDDHVITIGGAIDRVGAASVSGTITTLLVFAPMLFITGILGSFIRILPISVIIALSVSLILSLIIIPLMSRYLVLPAKPSDGPISRALDKVADAVASLPSRFRGIGVAGFLLSIVMTGIGLFVFAPNVGFNIFPPSKDSNFVTVEYVFPPGTSVEQAEAITLDVNQQAITALGDDLVDFYYYFDGPESEPLSLFTLSDMGSRPVANDLVDDLLQPIADRTEGARVVFNQLSNGPPELLFPFQVQVFAEDETALLNAADTISATLDGAAIERPNGSTFTVVETSLNLTDTISRIDGRRYVEVLARFDADDLTTTTAQTQEFLETEFDQASLADLGLEADALGFDFGLESDNQESFASLPFAFLGALGAMLVLLVFQFRSSVQWLLVFLAIPFSFFGVFGGLLITDNRISFFVMLGLLGLIGIAVNNTILLLDFANQERDRGATRQEAITTAMRRRFRPLVATTLTTVAGVLPLALSDPFWEALGFTIIFGLISSTFLVLFSFPYYYLAFEAARDRVRTPWRRRPNADRIDPTTTNATGDEHILAGAQS